MIGAIAAQQSLILRRQRVSLVGLVTMLAVTVMAGILGWSSHRTIVRVFEEAVRLQAAAGQPSPPNPFLLKPALTLLSNMIIYIPLIGGLVAIVVGHLSLINDQSAAMGRLLFTRQLSRTDYALGKILSSARYFALTMVGCELVSLAALSAVDGIPTGAEALRLTEFFTLSWTYLMVFVLVGMLTALLSRHRSLGLLSAIGVWLVVTFVAPQFTSGLRPMQSTNPLTESVGTSQTFFQITQYAKPLSIVEQYKSAASTLLDLAPAGTTQGVILATVPVLAAWLLLTLLVLWKIQRHDYARGSFDE